MKMILGRNSEVGSLMEFIDETEIFEKNNVNGKMKLKEKG